MNWFKRGLFQAGIVVTATALFLVMVTWTSVSLAHAQGITSEAATLSVVTVQATPTEDATVTTLNKEKLAQEVQQLKEQNEPDFFGWLRINAPLLLSTLVVVIGGLIGFFRWFRDRRDMQDKELKERQNEQEKRAEERFQFAASGLGDEKEGARISAAILLRTFLRPDYEQFYTQTFDLAIAHLRLPRTPQRLDDSMTPLPLTTLNQALISVFRESFPLARDLLLARSTLKEKNTQYSLPSLDAMRVQLDYAYLNGADLERVWMPFASLRFVDFRWANLSKANLSETHLGGAVFVGANLSKANLLSANLNSMMAIFLETDFSGANLSWANLSLAEFSGANFSGADLEFTNLSECDLHETNLEDALSLEKTNLHGVKGLTKEQLAACKAKGAIIDEDLATNIVAPPSSSQRNDAQATSAQGSTSPPDVDGKSAVSSSHQDLKP